MLWIIILLIIIAVFAKKGGALRSYARVTLVVFLVIALLAAAIMAGRGY